MCTQIDFVFSCGHRSFDKFDNCPNFGQTCLGDKGRHGENPVDMVCYMCKVRNSEGEPKLKDPWGADDPWKRKTGQS